MLRGLLVVVGMALVTICLPSAVIATAPAQGTFLAVLSSGRVNGPTRSGDTNIQVVRSLSQGTDKATGGKRRQARNRPQDAAAPSKSATATSGPASVISPDQGIPGQEQSQPNTPVAQPSAYSPQAKTTPTAAPRGSVDGQKLAPDRSGGPDMPLSFLEIEVSHSGHTFKLLRHHTNGSTETLHECRVGLGGPGFPTPVGTYYVTHIYDDNPWWIPPKDRAWAAGDSPSKRVYGGTMAPLLKKRPVRVKKQAPISDIEDKIEGQVQLDDYGYRFHGTNQPRSIGRNQSHGCVRMLPADAQKVASLIKELVGEESEGRTENGTFKILKAPVRLNLVK